MFNLLFDREPATMMLTKLKSALRRLFNKERVEPVCSKNPTKEVAVEKKPLPEMAATLPDNQRSAFGLGWEYRRRGRPVTDNPFDIAEDRKNHNWFREGWEAFIPRGSKFAGIANRGGT